MKEHSIKVQLVHLNPNTSLKKLFHHNELNTRHTGKDSIESN